MANLDKYTQKAIDDPHFRSKLLKDASKAIKEEFDYDPPYKITYHISDENHVVFTLPPEDGALDDNDLNSVAGGVQMSNSQILNNMTCGYMCFNPSFNIKF